MSRMSLCSRAQRPTGIRSSERTVCRRSVIVERTVEELGFEGMKKTLVFVSGCMERVEVDVLYPVMGILVVFIGFCLAV